MEIDIIDEIKTLHNYMIRRLFNTEKFETTKRPKPLQLAILAYLTENEDKVIYQKDLEVEFEISKAAISDVLNSMENNNMIMKIQEENDARKKRVVLTDESHRIYNEMAKTKKETNASILKDISQEELNKFLEVTEKLKENMKREGKQC